MKDCTTLSLAAMKNKHLFDKYYKFGVFVLFFRVTKASLKARDDL